MNLTQHEVYYALCFPLCRNDFEHYSYRIHDGIDSELNVMDRQ